MNLDNNEQVVPTPLEIGEQRAPLLEQAAAPLAVKQQTTFEDVKQREDESKAILEDSTVFERRAADLAFSAVGGVARWAYHKSIPSDPDYLPSSNFDNAWDNWGSANVDHLMEANSQEEYEARENDLRVRQYHAKAMETAGMGEKTAQFITTLVPDLASGFGAPVAAIRVARAVGMSAQATLRLSTAAAIAEGVAGGAGFVYGDPESGAGDALLFMALNTTLSMGVQRMGMKGAIQDDFVKASKQNTEELTKAVKATTKESAKAASTSRQAQTLTRATDDVVEDTVDAAGNVVQAAPKDDVLTGFGYEKLQTGKSAEEWVGQIESTPELKAALATSANTYERAGFGEHARLLRSESPAARMFASTLLDDGSTGARQNMTATGYNQMYQMQLESKFQSFDPAWRDYRSSLGHTAIPGTKLFINPKSGADSFLSFQSGVWDILAQWDLAGARAVTRDMNPHMLKAANAHADTMQLAPNILRNGDTGTDAHRVIGSEGLKPNPGYMTLKWSNDGIKAYDARYGTGAARSLVATGYSNRGMDASLADEIAGAVLKRQEDKALGLGGSNADFDAATTIVDDVLNGSSRELTKGAAEAIQAVLSKHGTGKQGYLRSRVDIDLTVPGMKELVDTNIVKNMRSYMGDVSGSAALARKGIRSKDELENILQATARDMAKADGSNFEKARLDLDDIVAGFMSRPVKDALNATGRRIQQGANLALLGQLGIMQAAETANIASHAFAINAMKSDAFKDTYRAIKDTFLGTRESTRTALVKEFEEATGVTVGIEDKIMRHAVNLDDKVGGSMSKFTKNLDYGLNSGNHFQGYISGYNFFRGKQQTIQADLFLNNMARISKQGSYANAAKQLSSAGIDEQLWKRFDNAIKKHATEVDGKVVMNFAKWESGLIDNVLVSTMRNMDQIIQTSRNGESPLLLSRGAGNFLSTLLKFPLLAMEKQMLRNGVEGGATQMVSAIAMGMLYNSALYTARSAMTSTSEEQFEQKMDPKTLLHGSLMMTPAAGITANMVGIMSGFMGGELYGSNYSSGGGLTSISPMLSFGDRSMQGIAKAAQGDPMNKQLMSMIPMSNALGLVHIKNNLAEAGK
jgi:hypothetical protein